MAYKNITRADVAREAGVSETIVSYVVNNNRYVDAQKRSRVLEAINRLGYRPNSIARALKGKHSNHIVFIADQINNEHFSQILQEMDDYAYDMGYMITLCQNHNSEEFVSRIISRRYDGVVISSLSFDESYIRALTAAQLPVVLLMNRDYKDLPDVGMIYTGLYNAARVCVRHLVGKGRRHILYIDRISKHRNFSTSSDLRLSGFMDEMKAQGFPFGEENIITGCTSAEEVEEKVRERFRSGFKIDAIFGRNDKMACMAMSALHTLGLKVPQDVSVIGFDNSTLSQYTTPALTTVEIQRAQIGRAAVQMLHKMIDGGSGGEVRHFTAHLIEREST